MNALNGYDAIQILATLVSKHGDNGEKIRDGLYSLKSYHGVGGILSFDTNGDANKPLNLYVVRDGKFVRY
jgi:ABC-type branched-subunit amino acid transport system substrate-binding protein